MIKRIVEISTPARLSLKNRQMVVERDGFESEAVPVEDMGVLVLDHHCILHTQGIMAACMEHNVAVVLCDAKHLPTGMLMPLDANAVQTSTIAGQARLAEPVRKRIWQSIITAKIGAQARTLHAAIGEAGPLPAFAKRVRSGDPDNIEAQAARLYWPRLFGAEFRRERGAPGINALLNYGYAVVRAACARAVVSTGLHPSMGLYHTNQYNALCLADDIMEPIRPAVDRTVHRINMGFSPAPHIESSAVVKDAPPRPLLPELTQENKRLLLEVLSAECAISDRKLPLMTALHYYAASVRKVIMREEKKVEIPIV